MTWSSPQAKLKSPSNNSNNKQTIIWSKRNATRCHMIGSHWFCGLFCSFSGSLLHPHQMLKYRVRLCSKTSTPQYLFLFKFWSWFLNKTPIRMATPARERERERERETRRLQRLRGVIFTTSFHWAGVITAAFLYVIRLIRCPQSHLSNLSVKH